MPQCPRCGAFGKVLFRTVMRGEVRIPVDPYLHCEAGHVVRLPRSSYGADSRRPGDRLDPIG
jgi:hypothetical protein